MILIWRIFGKNLNDLFIKASSFDEALNIARKINADYCSGQLYERKNND